MKLVRRDFLQLAGAMIAASAASQSTKAQTPATGPNPTEILRGDLLGQGHKVTETVVTVVAFPPGAVSAWHLHPGAQELVFGLQGKLTLEIEGQPARPITIGETGLIPADVPHTVRNEAAEAARILVVYSRSDKDKPLRVDVKKS